MRKPLTTLSRECAAVSKNNLTMSLMETARELGVGRNQIYKSAHLPPGSPGALPVIRIGKRILVVRAALDQMLAAPTGSGGVRKMKPRKAAE